MISLTNRLLQAAVAFGLVACSAQTSPPPAHPKPLRFEPGVAEVGRKEKLIALAPQLDAFFRERLDARGATGLAVGIVVDGELVYVRGFGVSDRESKRPIEPDTVFRIASMSKSFTAMAVLKLRDEGKLSLDEPIAKYLPELQALSIPTRDSPPITARLLLTHASGLVWDDLWGAVSFGFTEAELAQLLGSGVTIAQSPGTTFEYSNLGYALLGRLVERVSGRPFRDYVTSNILRPLGMHSTFWSAEQVPAGRLAAGYWGPEATRAPTPTTTVFAPAGGLYTTARDYARYMAYHLSAYPPRDEPEHGPVRRSTLREMHQGQRLALTPDEPIARRTASGTSLHVNSVGFGWFSQTTCHDEGRLEHHGWEPGYASAVILLPKHNFGVVTLATSQGVRAVEDVLAIIRDAGALPPEREVASTRDLLAAQQRVTGLLTRWDKGTFDATFVPPAVNWPWVASLEKEFSELARDHGRCEPEGALAAHSITQARFRMRCERGAIEFTVDLSPTKPGLVQWLRYQRELPPDEHLARAAQGVADAIGGNGAAAVAEAIAEQTKKELAHAAIDHGRCRIERGLSRDSAATSGVFTLACDQGRLDLVLNLDAQTRKITELTIGPPRARGDACWD